MEDDFEGDLADGHLAQFKDYEEYLDHHMSETDLFYLED